MKKIKIFAILIIAFVLLILSGNGVYALEVGDKIKISESGMAWNSESTYCVEHDQDFADAEGLKSYYYPVEFKVGANVEINGTKAIFSDGCETDCEENAIMAAILATEGPLQKGYADLKIDENGYEVYTRYHEAQTALYGYWNTWVNANAVGNDKHGFQNCKEDYYYNGETYYNTIIGRAKSVKDNNYSVKINFLANTQGLAIQKLIKTEEITKPKYKGEIEISGKVWEDGAAGKANEINSIFANNTSDKLLQGIKATLKDKDGKIFAGTSSVTTDANGNYTIKISTDDYDTTMSKLNNGAYVEFEYNGVTYTTVKYVASGENTSRAKENPTVRTNFDKAHTVVAPTTNTSSYGIVTADTRAPITSFKDYSHKTEETVDATTKKAYIRYVNLGLFRREQPDMAITSDIEKVDVTKDGQKLTYYYGIKGAGSVDDYDLTVKFQNKYVYTYRRPVAPADVIDAAAGNSEIKVNVTYKISVKNQSNTLMMKVHNIVNYYDPQYTILSSGWQTEQYNAANKYKKATSGALNVSIEPQKAAEIRIEYEVSQEAIKQLINQEATMNNVVEIHTYSTQYGNNTLCAETATASSLGRNGMDYAGVDVDSHPGNAVTFYDETNKRLDVTTYEDDTDIAPAFVLCLDSFNIISGNVWEDTDENGGDNERLGNGIKDGTERSVSNVKVELLKVKDDGTLEVGHLIAIKDGKKADGGEAVTFTDSNGNYKFGSDEASKKSGVDEGIYIIRYTYGSDVNGSPSTINGNAINARNYKSTVVTQNPVKDIMKNRSTSMSAADLKWYSNIVDNASVAVDNVDGIKWVANGKTINIAADGNARINTDSNLKYSNFDAGQTITAYSLPFDFTLASTGSQESQGIQVDENGKPVNGEASNECSKFDFGIIERPRENIVVDKSISYVRITLANGQILTEGDPRGDNKLNYVKALGIKTPITTEAAVSPLEKLLSIEMDSELIQGAKLELQYAITVTNNSENDYEYTKGNKDYYYYGDKNSELIQESVEWLLDYVDPELTCVAGDEATIEENKVWLPITAAKTGKNPADFLKDDKTWISYKKDGDTIDKTYETLKGENYLIFATNEFKDLARGDTKTINLSASKILANQGEDYTYENHVEIAEINGKIARTINSVRDNGEQVTKKYKSGNYIPSLSDRHTNDNGTLEELGLHQQDDDRIVVRITPPTGLTTYIMTYVIAGTIGLIVLVGGIFLIKKKIVTK